MWGTFVGRMAVTFCLLIIALLALPYLVLDGGEISVYYGVGPVSPLYLIVLPAVVAVALTGSLRGRSDAATAAGAGVAISTLLGVFVVLWALAAGDVAGGLTVAPTFAYHRVVLVASTVGLVFLTALFARAALRGAVPQGP
jgi:hypothetical protein